MQICSKSSTEKKNIVQWGVMPPLSNKILLMCTKFSRDSSTKYYYFIHTIYKFFFRYSARFMYVFYVPTALLFIYNKGT